jgi:HSP20 family molecular chaperone IbpA
MARARQTSLDDRHPLDGAQTVRTSPAHSSRTRSSAPRPDNVDQARVKAEFKDGLLNVHLPKSEKGQARAVDVKIA